MAAPSAEAIRARITALKLSPSGERWVTQALYPPGDLTRVAIPTRTHYPTLRIEYRPTSVLTAAGAGNWDLLLYSPPGDTTGLIWAKAPSGTAGVFQQTATPASGSAGYLSLTPNIATDVIPINIVIRNTAGAAASASYDIIPNPVKHQGFRLCSKSYTAHMTASDLYNSGTVTSCQYDTTYEPSPGFYFAGSRPVVPCVGSVPLDEDEITSSSPYAVVAAAKDGVFVPHRLLGPTFGFRRPLPVCGRSTSNLAGNTWSIADLNPTDGLMIGVMPRFQTPGGTTSTSVPWWLASVYATAARPDDMNFDAVATGVSIFRGLNNNATITVTMHVGMECILQAESPFRTMAGDPDEPDMRAINSYFEIAARMPHAYPASYNALGLVLPAIASALRAVVPHLPKVWEGIKTVAPMVAPMIPALSGLFDKKAEEKEKPPRRARQRLLRDAEELVEDARDAGRARPQPRPRKRAATPQRKVKQQIFAKRRRSPRR